MSDSDVKSHSEIPHMFRIISLIHSQESSTSEETIHDKGNDQQDSELSSTLSTFLRLVYAIGGLGEGNQIHSHARWS